MNFTAAVSHSGRGPVSISLLNTTTKIFMRCCKLFKLKCVRNIVKKTGMHGETEKWG
jgi:hypothetical protein